MNKKYAHTFHIGDGLKKHEHDILAYTQANDYDGVKAALNENPASICQRDSDDMDALHWAICNNNRSIAELLLRFEGKKAVTEQKPQSGFSTHVHEAQDEVFKIDFSREDAFGRTYAQIALSKGNPKMIKLLTAFQFPEAFDPDSAWNNEEVNLKPDAPKPRL